ncbi:hypothetical protein DLAC_10211 [Tieghemostelium lacteum]|uniref:Uncharacterized protein n=1 Tax=Tieghemostelium lacteum TaxID=361077 RepID=A0A151Z4Y1_TIELA|nr:hypothetical protein DLAC_10211 [Tieghemostelium lacteum]|eukprot:KYQ88995.1 hypothetical protein DLAC_10211 [Tieghemostelium lacteum]
MFSLINSYFTKKVETNKNIDNRGILNRGLVKKILNNVITGKLVNRNRYNLDLYLDEYIIDIIKLLCSVSKEWNEKVLCYLQYPLFKISNFRHLRYYKYWTSTLKLPLDLVDFNINYSSTEISKVPHDLLKYYQSRCEILLKNSPTLDRKGQIRQFTSDAAGSLLRYSAFTASPPLTFVAVLGSVPIRELDIDYFYTSEAIAMIIELTKHSIERLHINRLINSQQLVHYIRDHMPQLHTVTWARCIIPDDAIRVLVRENIHIRHLVMDFVHIDIINSQVLHQVLFEELCNNTTLESLQINGNFELTIAELSKMLSSNKTLKLLSIPLVTLRMNILEYNMLIGKQTLPMDETDPNLCIISNKSLKYLYYNPPYIYEHIEYTGIKSWLGESVIKVLKLKKMNKYLLDSILNSHCATLENLEVADNVESPLINTLVKPLLETSTRLTYLSLDSCDKETPIQSIVDLIEVVITNTTLECLKLTKFNVPEASVVSLLNCRHSTLKRVEFVSHTGTPYNANRLIEPLYRNGNLQSISFANSINKQLELEVLSLLEEVIVKNPNIQHINLNNCMTNTDNFILAFQCIFERIAKSVQLPLSLSIHPLGSNTSVSKLIETYNILSHYSPPKYKIEKKFNFQ